MAGKCIAVLEVLLVGKSGNKWLWYRNPRALRVALIGIVSPGHECPGTKVLIANSALDFLVWVAENVGICWKGACQNVIIE